MVKKQFLFPSPSKSCMPLNYLCLQECWLWPNAIIAQHIYYTAVQYSHKRAKVSLKCVPKIQYTQLFISRFSCLFQKLLKDLFIENQTVHSSKTLLQFLMNQSLVWDLQVDNKQLALKYSKASRCTASSFQFQFQQFDNSKFRLQVYFAKYTKSLKARE